MWFSLIAVLTSPAFSEEVSITLLNQARVEVEVVYVSAPGEEDWSIDIRAGRTVPLPVDSSESLQVPSGTWDLWVLDASGQTMQIVRNVTFEANEVVGICD